MCRRNAWKCRKHNEPQSAFLPNVSAVVVSRLEKKLVRAQVWIWWKRGRLPSLINATMMPSVHPLLRDQHGVWIYGNTLAPLITALHVFYPNHPCSTSCCYYSRNTAYRGLEGRFPLFMMRNWFDRTCIIHAPETKLRQIDQMLIVLLRVYLTPRSCCIKADLHLTESVCCRFHSLDFYLNQNLFNLSHIKSIPKMSMCYRSQGRCSSCCLMVDKIGGMTLDVLVF